MLSLCKHAEFGSSQEALNNLDSGLKCCDPELSIKDALNVSTKGSPNYVVLYRKRGS